MTMSVNSQATAARPRDGTPWYWYVTVTAVVFASAWGSIELTRGMDRVAAIWVANAVLLAIILTEPRRNWPALLLLGYCANVAANLYSADGLLVAAVLSICNTVEVVIAALLVQRSEEFDFARPRYLLRFCF